MSVPQECRVNIVPLRKFRTDREIPLDGCRVKELDPTEKQIICDSIAFKMTGRDFCFFEGVNFVIESPLSQRLASYDIVAALRVFKPEAVQNLPDMTVELDQNAKILDVHSCKFWMSLYEPTTDVYTLSGDEVENFRGFWRNFSKAIDFPFMATAIHRFSNAYLKGFAGDRLVDYVIALEALFSENSESIGYKLACRVPVFTHKETEERRKTREYVRIAYRIRSSLVHGSEQSIEEIFQENMERLVRKKMGSDEINFATDFLSRIREIVRIAICKFVIRLSSESEKRGRSEILVSIDDELIGKGSNALSC
jgi:hypothetical protein